MKHSAIYAAAVLLTIGAVSAVELPAVREGLWSNHSQTITQPGNEKTEGTNSVCRSHAFDEHVRSLSKGQNCKTINENVSGGTWTNETECTVGNTVIHAKIEATMSGDTIHSETRTTYTPPLRGMSGMTRIMDSKYVGSCPAGTQPGDIIAQDGAVTHTWKH